MAENHGGTRVLPREQQKDRHSKEKQVVQAEAELPTAQRRATTSCTSFRAISTKASSR